MSPKGSTMQVKRTLTEIDINELKGFLNVVDTNTISFLNELGLPSVKCHKLIYIPKIEPDFNKLCQIVNEVNVEGLSSQEENKYIPSENDLSPSNTMFHDNSRTFDPESHVQVRIIWDCEFPYDFKNNKPKLVKGIDKKDKEETVPQSSFYCLISWISSRNNKVEYMDPIEEIIIHVHGGGFIGMSSSGYMICTRKWAKEV